VNDAAKLLRLSPNYIRYLLRKGIIKGSKLNNTSWRIPEANLQELLKEEEGDTP